MIDLSQEMADAVYGWSNIATVAGTALALAGAFGTFWSGGIRDRYSDERISGNEAKTARAVADAALANQRAEEEHLARVKIEERLAPRTLTASQQSQLQSMLAGSRGTTLDILVYGGGSADALPLAGMIAESLNQAGWNVRVWNTIAPGRWVRGVVFSTYAGSNSDTEGTVTELANALNAVGLSSGRASQFVNGDLPDAVTGAAWDTNNVAPIRMMIGTKP